MSQLRDVHEFLGHQLAAAVELLEELPGGTRVYIERWANMQWECAYGGPCDYATRSLTYLKLGVRFRVRLMRPH